MGVSIAREEDPVASRRLLAALTARLPEWFGQPERRTRAFYERLGFELVLSRDPPGSSPNPLVYYLKPL